MNLRAVTATKIKADVESYLGKHDKYRTMTLYTDKHYRLANGFTSKAFEHVVIKAASDARLSGVITNEIRQSISAAIALKQAGQLPFTFSEVLRKFG